MALVTIRIVTRSDVDDAFRRIRAQASSLTAHLRSRFSSAFASLRTGMTGLRGHFATFSAFVRRHAGLMATHFRAGFARIRSGAGRLVSSMGGIARSILSSFGRLGSSLAQSLAGALGVASNNPYVLAAIVALAASASAAIGAALAGGISLAFGASFVGLGFYLLKDNKKVEKAWSNTTSHLKKTFSHAADGLIPVVTHASSVLQKMGDEFAPHFKQAMDKAAPSLNSFIDNLQKGFEKFGKRAFKPMMDAFNIMLEDVLGPELRGMLSTLGKSFGALGRTVQKHSVEIGMVFHVLLGVIPLAIDAVNFLANAFAVMVRGATAGFGYLVKYGVAYLVRGLMEAFGGIIHGAAKAFGWIPGLGGKLKSADRAFRGWKDKTYKYLQDLGQESIDVGKKLDQMNKVRQLKMNIRDWQAKAEAAKAKLRTVPKSKQAKLRADISDLDRKIKAAKSHLFTIHGKTVYIDVVTRYMGKVPGTGGLRNIGGIARATGGIVGHAAEGGPRANLTMVGEHGPELVDLAPGSRVHSNPDTGRMLSGGRGGSGEMTIILQIGDKKLGDLIIDPLRKSVRTRGGNVQAVLGG